MKKQITTTIILLSLFSMNAFGVTLELSSPSIWSSNVNEKQQKKLVNIQNYMNKKLKFLDGMDFASSGFIQQGFNGTSTQTSHFITLLIESKIWEVNIVFNDYGEQKTAFRTGQKSSKTITIIINSRRDDFLLKDFVKFISSHEIQSK